MRKNTVLFLFLTFILAVSLGPTACESLPTLFSSAGVNVDPAPAETVVTTKYKIFVTHCDLPDAGLSFATAELYSDFEPWVGHPQVGTTYAHLYDYWMQYVTEGGKGIYRSYPDTKLNTVRPDCSISSRPEKHSFKISGPNRAEKIQ